MYTSRLSDRSRGRAGGKEEAQQNAGTEFSRLSGAPKGWFGAGGHSSATTAQVALPPCAGGTSVL